MIRFDHITKQYPGTSKPALNSVDLEILRGEFVFLVGASGSGKSSCLRLMLKEEKPTSGRIHVLGQDLRSISNRKVPYFRRNLGVVFQDFRLLPNKSVYDNVAFSLQVIGKSRGFIQEAVPDTLTMVGLAEKAQRLPHELSGGEQQRVAIARAIVNKPQILLADEPTGNLDPTTSAGIMALLARINEGGTTVVMATHEAGIVDQMKRRVIELSGGQIVRDEREGGYKTSAIPVQAAEPVVVPPAVPVRVAGPESDPQPEQQPQPESAQSQGQSQREPQPATVPVAAVAPATPVLPPTAAVDLPVAFGPGVAQAPAGTPSTAAPAAAATPAPEASAAGAAATAATPTAAIPTAATPTAATPVSAASASSAAPASPDSRPASPLSEAPAPATLASATLASPALASPASASPASASATPASATPAPATPASPAPGSPSPTPAAAASNAPAAASAPGSSSETNVAAGSGPGTTSQPDTRTTPVVPPAPVPFATAEPGSAPVTRPVPVRVDSSVAEEAQEHVAEQLTLAEKLGLRAPGERPDLSGEQNVGPTR